MNASNETPLDLEDELRPHYDMSIFKNGVRGKYYGRVSNVVHVTGISLDPDLAPAFPDAASVNAALRQYLKDHPQPANPA